MTWPLLIGSAADGGGAARTFYCFLNVILTAFNYGVNIKLNHYIIIPYNVLT